MKIVLFQPQIPQNTGNIVRTCSVTGNSLILVKPLGFSTSNRQLKRAGLDYWEGVDVVQIDDLLCYLEDLRTPFYFFSSHATKLYTTVDYTPDDHLIFGSETAGLPAHFHEKWRHRFYTLPMKPNVRCLNLSNTVSIVVFEAWKRHNFSGAGR
jgi:tRNA (cytidine/uridine-2'-O-)-methyltransferase